MKNSALVVCETTHHKQTESMRTTTEEEEEEERDIYNLNEKKTQQNGNIRSRRYAFLLHNRSLQSRPLSPPAAV
jgi:hypothetical protein